MQLRPEIRTALERIDFGSRCKNLSEKYWFASNEGFGKYDNKEAINVFKELGYKAVHIKKENFFRITEGIDDYKFEFNISLKYGGTEFIWAVWKGKELQTGSPWGVLKKLLESNDERVRSPIFRNYHDLKEILQEALLMYEDFKRELLSIYNCEKEE
jgi:hypothetical protein